MGTGTGEYCKRCGEQLNYEDGFNREKMLCNKCDHLVKYKEV